MKAITESDWQAIEHLAERVNYSSERIAFLRRRLDIDAKRNGAPLILIAGIPKCGIEQLLAHLLNPQIVDELEKSERPIVIGKSAATVQPRVGAWPTFEDSFPNEGTLIALRIQGKPPADTLAQIASLGYVDQFILVTRLGQPLQIKERELAKAFGSLTMTISVVVVGFPGEAVNEGELAEVSNYIANLMRQAGFDDSRLLRVKIWFTDGTERKGTISEIKKCLTIDRTNLQAAKNGMINYALWELFTNLRSLAETMHETSSSLPLPDDEQARLIQEFKSYLTDLKREVEREKQSRRLQDTKTLQQYIVDTIRSWRAYTGVEGHWLRYVERIKPGMQANLMLELSEAVSVLEYQADNRLTETSKQSSNPKISNKDFYMTLAKRFALAPVGGAIGVIISMSSLSSLHTPIEPFVSGGAFAVGTGAGYFIAKFIFPTSDSENTGLLPYSVNSENQDNIHGWIQFERRLVTLVSEQLHEDPGTPLDEWKSLVKRLQIKELGS